MPSKQIKGNDTHVYQESFNTKNIRDRYLPLFVPDFNSQKGVTRVFYFLNPHLIRDFFTTNVFKKLSRIVRI
jgi:hypothetical protein